MLEKNEKDKMSETLHISNSDPINHDLYTAGQCTHGHSCQKDGGPCPQMSHCPLLKKGHKTP